VAMTAVFSFKFKDIDSWSNRLIDKKTLRAVTNALQSKNVAPGHISAFAKQLEKFSFVTILKETKDHVGKYVVAPTPPARRAADLTTRQRVQQHVVLTPQQKALMALVDVSVHIKGDNVELHYTNYKGAKKVLLSVERPRTRT
jgi:hypothetical protein